MLFVHMHTGIDVQIMIKHAHIFTYIIIWFANINWEHEHGISEPENTRRAQTLYAALESELVSKSYNCSTICCDMA